MHMGIRAIILGTPLALDPAREKDPGKIFVGDTNPRIGFVIFEQNIVARLIFLYQRIFEVQSILLGIDKNVLQIGNMAHQDSCFGRIFMHFVEVRRNPALQVLRLTYIYNLPLFVEILIHARCLRQESQNIPYMLVGGGHNINI